MAESSSSSLVIPLMGGLRRWALTAMCFFWLLTAAAGFPLENMRAVALACGVLVLLFRFAYLYAGSYLVLDADGIWITRWGTSRGLRWHEVTGYDRFKDGWVILGRNRQRLELPRSCLLDYHSRWQEVQRVLDRHVGPDGERPAMARPDDPVLAQLHDHYGMVPPVEMEPGVVYRNGHRDDLRRAVREKLIVGGAAILTCLVLLIFRSRIGFMDGPTTGLMVIAIPLLVPRLIQAIQLSRRIDDRFIVKSGVLYRIRAGQERALPAPKSKPGPRVFSQSTTRYGWGPFAYDVSTQFLEPDV